MGGLRRKIDGVIRNANGTSYEADRNLGLVSAFMDLRTMRATPPSSLRPPEEFECLPIVTDISKLGFPYGLREFLIFDVITAVGLAYITLSVYCLYGDCRAI